MIRLIKAAIGSFFLILIKGYQYLLSPMLGSSCRYIPSCSSYGIEAIQKYGPFKGGWLTIKRIARCHPWSKHGPDPVP